jgi:WhiB family redox-sensing transcriptional regulator
MGAELPVGVTAADLRAANVDELARTTKALGRCAETDPEIFFPEKGGSVKPAIRVCSGCEVRRECLILSLVRCEPHGVWGGLTERRRRDMLPTVRAVLAGVSAPRTRESEAA